MRLITRAGPQNLLRPVFLIGLWPPLSSFASMPMPEATMHKYHLAAGDEDKIRLSRQVFSMKPEPKTQFVGETANQ